MLCQSINDNFEPFLFYLVFCDKISPFFHCPLDHSSMQLRYLRNARISTSVLCFYYSSFCLFAFAFFFPTSSPAKIKVDLVSVKSFVRIYFKILSPFLFTCFILLLSKFHKFTGLISILLIIIYSCFILRFLCSSVKSSCSSGFSPF